VQADPLLRRVERSSAAACAVMAVAALVLSRGDARAALGVVGGWVLIAVGYSAIKSAVDAIVAGARGSVVTAAERRRLLTAAVVKIAGRYALLAILAYVMIARLRLHPLGLLAGVSSAVAAVSIEAIRLLVIKR
jgi:hypothetical protein